MLVLAHAEYMRRVCAHVARLLRLEATNPEHQATLRRVGLMALRSGVGDEGVSAVFVKKVRREYARRDGETLDDWVERVGVRLTKWSDEELRLLAEAGLSEPVIVCDEANVLLGSMHGDFLSEATPPSVPQRRDGYNGLLQAIGTGAGGLMSREQNWRVVMVGTHRALGDLVASSVSPIRGGTSIVESVHLVDEDMMWTCLSAHFNLPLGLSREAVGPSLAKFRGRAYYFYDMLFPKLLRVRESLTALVHFRRQCTEEEAQCLSHHAQVWRSVYDDPGFVHGTHTLRRLMGELYAGVVLGGRPTVIDSADVRERAARAGSLALPGASVALPDEPIAFRSLTVFMCGQDGEGATPDRFQSWLGTLLGEARSLGVLTSAKGTSFEAWVVHSVLRKTLGVAPNLSRVWATYLSGSYPFLEGLDIAAGLRGFHADGGGIEVMFDSKGMPLLDVIAWGFDAEAGFDVAFFARRRDGTHVLVAVQCKVVSKLAITDAIRAASPEWQYMDATQRDQVIDKKAVAYSGKRRDYVSFLRSKRAMDMFDGAVRVVFSFGGFQTKTVQMVEALNAGARRTRPLVLCHIPATMRSADAAVEAMDDDAEYSPAPHPTDATMTRSQAILEGKTISDVGPAAASSRRRRG
jgi:hypothetical protein